MSDVLLCLGNNNNNRNPMCLLQFTLPPILNNFYPYWANCVNFFLPPPHRDAASSSSRMHRSSDVCFIAQPFTSVSGQAGSLTGGPSTAIQIPLLQSQVPDYSISAKSYTPFPSPACISGGSFPGPPRLIFLRSAVALR